MGDAEESSDSIDQSILWDNLVEWVQKSGGYVHPALHLQGQGPSRGVFSSAIIPKGDLLIRIPPSCVVGGSSVKGSMPTNSSSWFKCLVAYYQAAASTKEYWQPYFESLPIGAYETLFQWTDEEVKNYLAGTTLGLMIEGDRRMKSMQSRYRLAVRPHLQELGLVPSPSAEGEISDEEFDAFLQACMCISTRGFHLTKKGDSDKEVTTNNDDDVTCGPFLLPVIDLLNHDPKQACTTLKRDNVTGSFCMAAERSIAKDETVVHSYGDSLTAAQLLQTFGFVPVVQDQNHGNRSLTPATFQKVKHLLAACKETKESTYPQELKEWMESQKMDEDEVWNIQSIPQRALDDDISADLLVCNENAVLSEELITLVSVQFLPDEAYNEVFPEDRLEAWLDRSILEDYYLGKLVCHSLLIAIRKKLDEYAPINIGGVCGSEKADSVLERDREYLKQLLQQPPLSSVSTFRAMYGLTIRIEELTCLKALQDEILGLQGFLDGQQPPNKRAKLVSVD